MNSDQEPSVAHTARDVKEQSSAKSPAEAPGIAEQSNADSLATTPGAEAIVQEMDETEPISGDTSPDANETDPQEKEDIPGDENLDQWQRKMLPVMTWTILALTAFFFLASLGQLIFLHDRIWRGSEQALKAVPDTLAGARPEDALAASSFDALAELELYVLERRYHQANVFLMSRVWVRYLGFVTGMILALIGAIFVLGKLREPRYDVKTRMPGGQFSFSGTSPGLLLVLVGLLLMGTTMIVHRPIDVRDKAIYVDDQALSVLFAPPTPLPTATSTAPAATATPDAAKEASPAATATPSATPTERADDLDIPPTPVIDPTKQP